MASNSVRKVALVTGAGDPAGMGAAIARRFARDGMAVGVLDIVGEGAQAVAKQISDAGGKALALPVDVTDRAQVEQAIARLRNAFGPIAVLVNNAAVEGWSNFGTMSDAIWDRTIEVNLKGLFIVTQTALPDMEAGGL